MLIKKKKDKLSNHLNRCLVWLGMATFIRLELHKTLRCSETTLQNWLALIEANYHRSNSYHNSTHASDVLHATAFFLEQDKLKEICDDVDGAICLLAAAIHDVDHPGKNRFLSFLFVNFQSIYIYIYIYIYI